jgi:hypothetical protein
LIFAAVLFLFRHKHWDFARSLQPDQLLPNNKGGNIRDFYGAAAIVQLSELLHLQKPIDVRSSSALIHKPIFNHTTEIKFNEKPFFKMLQVIRLCLKKAYDCGFNAM